MSSTEDSYLGITAYSCNPAHCEHPGEDPRGSWARQSSPGGSLREAVWENKVKSGWGECPCREPASKQTLRTYIHIQVYIKHAYTHTHTTYICIKTYVFKFIFERSVTLSKVKFGVKRKREYFRNQECQIANWFLRIKMKATYKEQKLS